MVDNTAPILPGTGLAGLLLGTRLPESGWTTNIEELPWEFSWAGPHTPLVSDDQSVVALVDERRWIRSLYATPRYRGTLLTDIHPGMLGRDILSAYPDWQFCDFDASIIAPGLPGFFLKHQELDIDAREVETETFDYIAVCDRDTPR